MARQHDAEQKPAPETTLDAPATEVAETAGPAFKASGPIPQVETTASATEPTASERAFGPAIGPGLAALEALLAKGAPKPEQVVAIIDGHRDERAAILARVESKLGATFVEQVHGGMGLRASVARREVVAGDPSDPSSGYFVASQAEQGARWRTGDGRFTGTAGRDGLDSKYRLDSDDTLHAHVGKDRTGTLAWERDGKNQGELYGSYRGSEHEVGVRRDWQLGDGQLTTGLRHRTAGGDTTDGAFGRYRTADGRTTVDGAAGVQQGQFAGSAGVVTKPTTSDTVSGEIAHDVHGTTLRMGETHDLGGGAQIAGSGQLHRGPEGTTGALTGEYKDRDTRIDGSVTRGVDQTALHLGASEQVSPQLSLSGALDHTKPDHGPAQSTLRFAERHRSPGVVQSLDVEAGHGARDYVQTSGSVEARLGQQLYGGAWGSYRVEEGHHQTSQIGGSLTFTPTEKTALTLAGVLDASGTLETRLELDIFKSRISSVADLADHKKDALVSLFISHSRSGSHQMLDDRFGAPQVGAPMGEQVRAGIKIKF